MARRNPKNPLRGVFATRAPVRPNLIALSRVRVISVRGNVIEIDGIDAFPDTPVLDLKPKPAGSLWPVRVRKEAAGKKVVRPAP